jgi:hypothetical protein
VKLVALVSENGLGHFRRTVAILAQLVTRGRVNRLDLLCEAWQVERNQSWRPMEVLRAAGATLHHEIMSPGPRWPLPDDDDARLSGWIDRARALPAVNDADLVLSDNLGGALALRADAVLLGSFLWSDVYARAANDSARVQRFVEHERGLLAAHRPPMLCVADLAMPGVTERTAAVPLPWMCEDVVVGTVHAAPGERVAVLGGAAGAADELLVDVAAALVRAGHDVAVPRAWLARLPAGRVREFGHAPEDFAACAAIVCRPGTGTLTQCVAANVPVVAVREAGNLEMEHNAARVAALGLGVDAGAAPASEAILAAIERVRASDARAHLAARAKDGVARAADWIESRVSSR